MTVIIVAALSLGSFINGRLPKADDVMDAPFVAAGKLGEPLRLRTGTVTVRSVNASSHVSLNGSVAEAAGLWLIVDLTFAASGERRYVALDTTRVVASDGRQFGDIAPLRPICGPIQPGLPMDCTFAVEVDADRLAGAHLRVPADSLVVGPPENNFADVDLGITDEVAAQLRTRTDVVELGVRLTKGA